jgi:hypothetical protein
VQGTYNPFSDGRMMFDIDAWAKFVVLKGLKRDMK